MGGRVSHLLPPRRRDRLAPGRVGLRRDRAPLYGRGPDASGKFDRGAAPQAAEAGPGLVRWTAVSRPLPRPGGGSVDPQHLDVEDQGRVGRDGGSPPLGPLPHPRPNDTPPLTAPLPPP